MDWIQVTEDRAQEWALVNMAIKSSVFLDITLFSSLELNGLSGGTCRLHVPELATCFTLVSCLAYSSILKIEATCS
jgi:hypothetical protein